MQPYSQLGILFHLGSNPYSLAGISRLARSHHRFCYVRQYVCCKIVLGPTDFRVHVLIDSFAFLVSSLSFRSFATNPYKAAFDNPPGVSK